ncbi:MAG TPA: hypothetical protein DCM61_07135 [Clostridiales bacterium]|nr:hypothetical protein [Clostridiales bacterium]
MGTLKSSLSSGLAKGQKAAEKQKRKGQQTAGGGKKSAAAYSAAPAKRHAEETETVKSESTPVYTAAKKSSSANAAVASSMHYSSSGSRHSGSHGSLGEVSVYEQRRQQRDAARKDFWNHTLDLLGTASAQAQRGALRVSVPVGLQIEEARRQEDNIRSIREANARFEATRQPIEWDGRAELISALERLDMQSGWEINEEQANAAEQQRQELLARLREGDLAAGNGVRSGTGADTGRDVVEGTAKGIAGAGVNLVSNLGQLMAKADAYSYSENEFLTDWMLGNDPSVMRQARIDAYESAEAKEYWSSIDAIADRLDNDAATVLRRAKEGKSIIGEAGVDAAKGVLEAGFDAGLATVTGGSALVPLAARVYGQSVGTARRAGATPEQQAAYGLTSAAIEVASEMLFDGVAKIYGAGAADDIVEKLVVELADSETGRGMLRFLAGAAGEGAEEVVSDLLSPLAEATYRDESLAELYRQLEPSELLYDYLIGASVSILASGASAATRQSGEASAEYRANEAEYFNILERNGRLERENAARVGTAEDLIVGLFQTQQKNGSLQSNRTGDIIDFKKSSAREKFFSRARKITSIDDLTRVSKSPVIDMKSYDEILQHFSQTHRVNVLNFEGRDLFSVKTALAGYDDMLQEFPDIMGHIHTIRFDPRIRALGQMGQGGLSLVGAKGLRDYGTGVHEAAHALDFARSKGGRKYSETVLAEARRRLGLRVNSREYKDLCFISTMDVKEMAKPEEVFAYAIETEKGGASNRLSKVIWEIIKEES